MNKKELEKLISEYKPKYLYQRYNGNLTKYEVLSNERIIEVETGITLNLETDYLLGKISNNIIDLIEVGDYVDGIRILDITGDYIHTSEFDCCKERLQNKIKSIVTHELFEERKFYV